jgi:hypothetical protein
MATLNFNASISGMPTGAHGTRTGFSQSNSVTPAVGQSGILTTRTSASVGVITFAEAHGLTDADLIDVGWVDTGVNKHRLRATITGYDTLTITIATGSGDDLPTEDDAVIVGTRESIPFAMTGDDLQLLSLFSKTATGETTCRAVVEFLTSAPANIAAFDLNDSDLFVFIDKTRMIVGGSEVDRNPLSGATVATIEVSSLSTTELTIHITIV